MDKTGKTEREKMQPICVPALFTCRETEEWGGGGGEEGGEWKGGDKPPTATRETQKLNALLGNSAGRQSFVSEK